MLSSLHAYYVELSLNSCIFRLSCRGGGTSEMNEFKESLRLVVPPFRQLKKHMIPSIIHLFTEWERRYYIVCLVPFDFTDLHLFFNGGLSPPPPTPSPDVLKARLQ